MFLSTYLRICAKQLCVRLQPAFHQSSHHSGCDNSHKSHFCLGRKHYQLVAAFTRAGHISAVIFRLDFKTTLANRLKGKPRNSTWTTAKKWKVSDSDPVPQNTRASGEKWGGSCPVYLLSSLQKQGEGCSYNKQRDQWAPADLSPPSTFALFRDIPSYPHCSPSCLEIEIELCHFRDFFLMSSAHDLQIEKQTILFCSDRNKQTHKQCFNPAARTLTASTTQGINLVGQNPSALCHRAKHPEERHVLKRSTFVFFLWFSNAIQSLMQNFYSYHGKSFGKAFFKSRNTSSKFKHNKIQRRINKNFKLLTAVTF